MIRGATGNQHVANGLDVYPPDHDSKIQNPQSKIRNNWAMQHCSACLVPLRVRLHRQPQGLPGPALVDLQPKLIHGDA